MLRGGFIFCLVRDFLVSVERFVCEVRIGSRVVEFMVCFVYLVMSFKKLFWIELSVVVVILDCGEMYSSGCIIFCFFKRKFFSIVYGKIVNSDYCCFFFDVEGV